MKTEIINNQKITNIILKEYLHFQLSFLDVMSLMFET